MSEPKGLRVLVADQNPVTQRVLANMTAFCGHNVTMFASDSETAWETLNDGAVDFALLDWSLLQADNLWLLQTMDKNKTFAKVPALIMVPALDQDIIETARKHGGETFISKPIPAQELGKKITETVKASGVDLPDYTDQAVFVDPEPETPSPEQAPVQHEPDTPKQPAAPKTDAPMTEDHATPEQSSPPSSAAHKPAAPSHTAKPQQDPIAVAKKRFLAGKELLKKQQYKRALTEFTNSFAAKTLVPEAYKGMGIASKGLGDLEKARTFFNKAAEAYVLSRRNQEAVSFYRELKKLGHRPVNPFKSVADSLRARGDIDRARLYYELALRLTPGDPNTAFALAKTYMQAKDNAKAFKVVVAILKLKPDLEWAQTLHYRLSGKTWQPSLDSLVVEEKSPTEQLAAPTAMQEPVSHEDVHAPSPSASPAPSPSAAPAGPADSGNRKILMVDDEPHIRMLLEQSLENLEDEGVTLMFAENGEEGLRMIQEETPALVFLDVMMPKMNGFDVCETVKQKLKLQNVYIAMLTAKGQEFDKQRGMEAGADVYMTKPFRPPEIVQLARAVLDL